MARSVSEKDVDAFLNAIFFRWAVTLFEISCSVYELDEEQKDAVEDILLKPNDWVVEKSPPLIENAAAVNNEG
jgi:hypothetical protein